MKYFKSIVMIVPLAAMGMTQAIAETATVRSTEAACSYYVVTASRLNVRAQPGLTSDIMDSLPKGRHICVSDFSGKWAKIDMGWVSSRYILADQKTVKATKVVKIAKETTTPSDLNGTKEETKVLAVNEEWEEPLKDKTDPSLAEQKNKVEEKKVETATDTQQETKKDKVAKEVEPVATKTKSTKKLAVEKEDTATTDYLKQIRTQQGVGGKNYIYLFEGNGDKCEIMILEKKTILANTCKPAINKSGEKMLCTWNKKMCKTEARILKEINKY